MKILELLRAQLLELDTKREATIAEMDAITEAALTESRSALNADEETLFAAAEASITQIDAERAALQARIDGLEAIAERTSKAQAGSAGRRPIVPGANTIGADDIRHMNRSQVNDAIVRSIEGRDIDPTSARQILKRHSGMGDLDWARNLAVRASDAYESGWIKLMTGRQHDLSAEERAAVAVGTNTQGGFLAPTHLDPTLIITNTGSRNAIRNIARVVTLTSGSVWHGVSTAGVTASWDGELVEVSDDSPSFTGPSVTTYQAQALVQASFAALEDTGFANDILMLFSDARDRLEGAAHCTGTGSGQPTGIFTAIDATSSREFTSTTAATIGLVDLQTLRRGVGVRFRERGTWVMAPVYADAIKALGTAVSASFSTDITQSGTQRLLGNPLVETDDAPTTQTTTVRDNEIIFGDFSNYVIADKPGSFAVEYIPNMFATANNLPNGSRAWFAHWRTGANSVNDAAFALLQDKTSA